MKIYIRCGVESNFVESNPETSPEILKEIVRRGTRTAKRMVAYNPNTPSYLLEELAGEDDNIIKSGVYDNPNTDPELKELLYEYFEGQGKDVMRAFHIKPRYSYAFASKRIRRRRLR